MDNLFGRPGFSHFTYTHFSGCRHRRICILPAQTFRVAGGFAIYLHTLSTTPRAGFLRNPFESIRKVCLYIEKCFALRAPFYLEIGKKISSTLNEFPRCARGLFHLIENEGDDLAKSADFQRRKLNLVGHFAPRAARGF